MIGDHQLNDFDEWFALFRESPPPSIGTWRLLRGSDDPNRVYVVGEVSESEVSEVKAFFDSDKMKAVLAKANDMSQRPMEILWLNEVKP
ncbi:MAG: hypothetical protein ACR2PH_15815 [Desulfobulbia bacterium]